MLPIRPEDVLADGADSASINGTIVRKGTIAAFLANSDIIEDPVATPAQIEDAICTMKELASAVIAIGLHKHVTFKNPKIEQILLDAVKE